MVYNTGTMILKKELIDFGLTENEAAVYLAALELGETILARIAKKAGIKRTTAYLAIESLKEKGLINTLKKNKRAFLYAEDPRILARKAEEKKEAIDKAIPQLLSITNLIDKKPAIKYFENKAGLEDIFKDVLNYPNKEVLVWFPQKTNYESASADFFDNYYNPTRLKRKISERTILPKNQATEKRIKSSQQKLNRVKIVDPENYSVDVETLIYGSNKVGIISYDEQIGLIIESQKIHDMHKSIFELVWKSLPDLH